LPLELKGRVMEGLGEGRKYVAMPLYNLLLTEILNGRAPFPGTLNIAVEQGVKLIATLCRPRSIRSAVINGRLFGGFMYWLGCINSTKNTEYGVMPHKVVVLRPFLSKHPPNVLEAVSSENLRRSLKLKSGDEVKLTLICGNEVGP